MIVRKRYLSLTIFIAAMIVMFSSGIFVATMLDEPYVPQRGWKWDEIIKDDDFSVDLFADALNDTTFLGDFGNYMWQANERGTLHRHFHYKLLPDGSLSPFDDIFRRYADSIRWDWRLLAALAYNESKFIPNLVSPKGAAGIMQIMPVTANYFGCSEDMVQDPEYNIRTGARLIAHLEIRLRRKIMLTADSLLESPMEADSALKAQVDENLCWYTLASYNAGLGHVYDAIALAEDLGYDPTCWFNNVESCMKLKNDTLYANRECVRLGKFNAKVTLKYVQNVCDTYNEFKRVKSK